MNKPIYVTMGSHGLRQLVDDKSSCYGKLSKSKKKDIQEKLGLYRACSVTSAYLARSNSMNNPTKIRQTSQEKRFKKNPK